MQCSKDGLHKGKTASIKWFSTQNDIHTHSITCKQIYQNRPRVLNKVLETRFQKELSSIVGVWSQCLNASIVDDTRFNIKAYGFVANALN